MNTDVAIELVDELVAEMNVCSPPPEVTEATTLRTDLGLNSLNLLILLVRLQERSGVELATASTSVSSFQTVGDVVRVLVAAR